MSSLRISPVCIRRSTRIGSLLNEKMLPRHVRKKREAIVGYGYEARLRGGEPEVTG